MSEESKDIITKEPQNPIIKQKDPKKVAAGKRLAEYHKKAKNALEIEKNRENGETIDDSVEETSNSWTPEISLTTALTLVGITLTAIDLYFRWRNNKKVYTPVKTAKMEDITPETNKIPITRIGME